MRDRLRSAKRAARGEAGQIELVKVGVLVIVLAAAGASGVLLFLTMQTAMNINEKAERIAKSGRGINISTDSIVQVRRTNEVASDVLEDVRPLDKSLVRIVELSREVDDLATSIDSSVERIDGTAADIEGSAGAIESTAGTINRAAAAILEVARLIDEDARLINVNLDTTIALALSIEEDTGNILGQAREAHQTTACIDRQLGGAAANDGHCTGGAS